MKETLLVISDMHINSTFGLCKPMVELDYGGSYSANKIQQWLFSAWENHLDCIEDHVHGTHSTLVFNGDIIDLDTKQKSWARVTRNPAVVQEMAADLLDPLVQMFDDLFVIRGTEPHVGKEGHGEESLASDFNAIRDPDTGKHSWRQLVAEFCGVKFDIAHHVAMGSMPWTWGGAANRLAVVTMAQYDQLGEPMPQVVIRGHQHRFSDSGQTYDIRGLTGPAWQWPAEYLDRSGKYNERPSIGSLLFEIENDGYEFKPLLYKPPRRTIWKKQ